MSVRLGFLRRGLRRRAGAEALRRVVGASESGLCAVLTELLLQGSRLLDDGPEMEDQQSLQSVNCGVEAPALAPGDGLEMEDQQSLQSVSCGVGVPALAPGVVLVAVVSV